MKELSLNILDIAQNSVKAKAENILIKLNETAENISSESNREKALKSINEDIIPRVADDDTIEAVMFCEGDLWEMLYYCEANGSNNEETKSIYQAFIQTTAEHGMWYEWGNGTIYLYGVS